LTWHAFNKLNGKVAVASSMELKAKDISCSGWEVRRDLMVYGIFVAEKWVHSIVSVKKHSKRLLILKMVFDNSLLNVLMVYAARSGKPEEEKENFWNEVYCVPFGEFCTSE